MVHNSSLGMLASLPRELRDQIWDTLVAKRKFAFLQASRQIHEEAALIVDSMIYTDVVLQFNVVPKYQYRSWLIVESSFNATWALNSLDHSRKRGFEKLPYEKLGKIQINIEAPDKTDPGQIVCLHKKCVDLATLLENAKQDLPHVEINLLESTSAQWHSGDKPQKSIYLDRQMHYPPKFIDPYKEESFNEHEDYVIVLYPFSRLRNARSAEVCRPTALKDDNDFGKSIARNIEETEPVGTYLNPDDPWDDGVIQREVDQIYMDLDLDLDLLDGPTAAMMRLDRFSSWYTDKFGGDSHYEQENERIIRSWADRRACHRRTWSLHRRYERMIALIPSSMKHRYTEHQPSKMRLCSSEDVKSFNKTVESSLVNEEWDQDAWHKGRWAWPKGIPPFYASVWGQTLKLGYNDAVTRKYQKAFMRKVTSWMLEDAGRYNAVEDNEISQIDFALRSVPLSDITGLFAWSG